MYERENSVEKPSGAETIDSLYEKLNDKYEESNQNQSERRMKKRAGSRNFIKLTIVFLILFLIPVVALPQFFKVAEKNKLAVANAFSNLAVDIKETSDKTVSPSELGDTLNMIMYGDSYMSYSLDVSGLDLNSYTVGIDGDMTRLYDDRLMESHDKISVMNIELVTADLFVQENDIFISAPMLTDELLKVNAETLAEDINSSVLSSAFGLHLQSADYRPFGDGINKQIHLTNGDPFIERYSAEIDALIDRMKASREVEKKEVILSDGKKLQCKTYRLILDKETATNLLRAVLRDFVENSSAMAGQIGLTQASIGSLSFSKDIVLDVTIDQKGNIREIRSKDNAQISNMAVGLDVQLMGEKTAIDMLTVVVKTSAPRSGAMCDFYTDGEKDKPSVVEEIALALMHGRNEITFVRNLNSDLELDIEASITGEYEGSMFYNGYLEYDRDNAKLTADVNRFIISKADQEIVHISGEFQVQPAMKKADEIDFLTDDAIEPFEMNVFDVIGNNIGNIVDQFGNWMKIIGGLF